MNPYITITYLKSNIGTYHAGLKLLHEARENMQQTHH